jgi:hypothetical protein
MKSDHVGPVVQSSRTASVRQVPLTVRPAPPLRSRGAGCTGGGQRESSRPSVQRTAGRQLGLFKPEPKTRKRRRVVTTRTPADPGWSVVFGGAFPHEWEEAERMFGYKLAESHFANARASVPQAPNGEPTGQR